MKFLVATSGVRMLAVFASATCVLGTSGGQERVTPERPSGSTQVQQGLGEAREVPVGQFYDRLYGHKANEQEAANVPAPVEVQNLLADPLEDRLRAVEALERERQRIASALVGNVRRLSRNPSRSVQGRFNMHLVAIGRLRTEEAIPVLAPMIDFHLDPEQFPVGVFAPMFYPVAETLVDIGGRDVAAAVIDLMSEPADSHRLFVSGWVLQEVLGRQAAKAAVVQAMQGATISPRYRDNLASLEKLLSHEELPLRGWFPERVRERLPRLLGDE